MAQITTEQALQIPQQLKRQGSQQGSGSSPAPGQVGDDDRQRKGILSDDAVTLHNFQAKQNIKRIEVNSYKGQLGLDNAFVKETLRTKLAEYNLNPNTHVTVKKDMFGNIEIKGAILQSDIDNISQDLNNSQTFKDAFSRLSQQQPTLNYVDNVVKLANAYGVGNSLFNSLVSDDNEFNKLNDLSHRYQALKANAELDQDERIETEFEFVLNGMSH